MYARLLALSLAAASLCLADPAAAEPPGPCGWTVDVDPPTVDVPLDRPAIFPARHWTSWNCDQGMAPMTITVRDAEDAEVAGDWQHDSVRDLMIWTPADGWPAPGSYQMRLDYVFDGDPGFDPPAGTPQTRMLELRVGEALPREGFAVDIGRLSVFGQDEQIIDCCDDGQRCWIDVCETRVRVDLDWTLTGPAGEPWSPSVWLEGIVEEAETPDAQPRVRWTGQGGEHPFSLRIDELPTCFRVRIALLPEGQTLVSSAWRCVEDYELVGPECIAEPPVDCGDAPSFGDAGVDGGVEPDTGADAGADAAADEEDEAAGESAARGRSGCGVAGPGGQPRAPWSPWLLGALCLGVLCRGALYRGTLRRGTLPPQSSRPPSMPVRKSQ